MKRVGKWIGIVCGALLVLLIAALTVFWAIQPQLYAAYYEEAEKEFSVAGLSDGLVPQGLSYIPQRETFVQCGYMADGASASRIYLTDAAGNERYVELLNADGSPYLGHTGGIAVGEKTVWLANDGEGDDNCVWALSLETLLDETTKQITLSERLFSESRAACCYVYDGLLWVGEFYYGEKCPTSEAHHLFTVTGEENCAFICGYAIDETQPNGVSGELPKKVLSVGSKMQGFAFSEDGTTIALSTSYGLANSQLYFHKNVLNEAADGTLHIQGEEVPLWILDGESLKKSVELPPMSEELTVVDGRLYIQCESASHKYVFGILTRGRHIYSYPF